MRNKALDFNYDCKRLEKIMKWCETMMKKAKLAQNDNLWLSYHNAFLRTERAKFDIGKLVLGVDKAVEQLPKEMTIQNVISR